MELTEHKLEDITRGTSCLNFFLQELNGQSPLEGTHRNNFYQLILLQTGKLEQTIDFRPCPLQGPAVCLIFPHQLHDVTQSDHAEGKLILFDETVFCSELLHNDLKDYNIDLQQRLNHIPLDADNRIFQKLTDIWFSIRELYENFNPISKMQIKLYIKIMILHLLQISPEKSLVSTSNEDTSLYIEFRERVDREFKENRIVQSYAENLNISVKRLTEICRHFSGMSPLEIIHEKLNLELKKAMAIGQMSLKEISFDFGFSSQAALNKYIEQKFSLTPMQLRDQLRNRK